MHAVANEVFDELKKQVERRRRPGRPGQAAADARRGRRGQRRRKSRSANWPKSASPGTAPAVLEGRHRAEADRPGVPRSRQVTVTEAELDAEVARVASLMVRPLPDGSPDVKAFLKTVVEKQGMTVDVYRHDAVWPTVALRKLACAKVQVTEEDVQNGFEANYGPRVRCRAIVLGQLRRAQQVWEMARKQPTAENFGDLAAQYSIEGSSRALRGEMPPIAKHCGQPMLEKEAFALKPGEMSGVIQLGDKFIILFCEGYTKPEMVEYGQGPRPDRGGRPREEAAAGDVRVTSSSCKRPPRSTTSSPARARSPAMPGGKYPSGGRFAGVSRGARPRRRLGPFLSRKPCVRHPVPDNPGG